MKTRVKNHTDFENKGKDLREFARNYLSEAFPNPDRGGCPPDSALRSLAFNPKAAERTVTEHLAMCSPCFRRYSELLAELMAQQRVEKASSWKRISAWTKAHPVLVAAALACALFIAIGVGLLLRGIRQPNAPPMDTHRKPNPTEPLNSTVAYLPYSMDLSALSPVRGSEPPATGPQRRVAVPSSPLNLTLTLPLASPEGPYDLKLTSKGRTSWSNSALARLQKGTTLIQVEVDFRKIPTGDYTLEVQSLTGIHLMQPVSIQTALQQSGEHNP
jgi:hypothetical protein